MMRFAGDDGDLREENHPDVVVHPITMWENTKSLDAIKKQFSQPPKSFSQSNPRQTRKEKPKRCDVGRASFLAGMPVPEPMIKCRRDSANYETGSCSGWVWEGVIKLVVECVGREAGCFFSVVIRAKQVWCKNDK